MFGIDPKSARSAWTYSAVFLSLYLLYVIRKTLLVFVIALLFAYLLYPAVDAIDRRLKWKYRTLAVIIPFAAILGSLTIFGLVVQGSVRREAHQLTEQIRNKSYENQLNEWTILGFPLGQEAIDNYNQIQSQIMSMMPQVGRGLQTAARDLGNLFIIPILSFFILKDGRRIRDSILEIWFENDAGQETSSEKRVAVESILMDAHDLILQYMRALLLLCLATLVCFTLVLSLLKVKYAVLLALIAFPLEFVPLVGPLTSAAIIIAVCALNRTQNPHPVWWIVMFLISYRLFQDYVLSPHLMNKSVKLHPLLIIFGIFAGGEIGRVGGIFLSVPILALARLVFYEVRKRGVASKIHRKTPQMSA